MNTQPALLDVQHLAISFTQYTKGLHQAKLEVISDLNVSIREGEMVAVVGASGSGKSLLAHGILGILPYNAAMSGDIFYRGERLDHQRQAALRGREIALVPQSVSFLDPLTKVGPTLRRGSRKQADRERATALLARYGLGRETEGLYPFELSGGMARRVLISAALMERPGLIIADEPTPGLHINAARRVLGHFREIADAGAGVLLITHDLELALEVADRVVVFYAGATVEDAYAADFARESSLRHPYTRAIWRAMPANGFQSTAGSQPYAGDMPEGCPFAPRCDLAGEECTREIIPWRPFRGGHVRCLRAGEEGGGESDS